MTLARCTAWPRTVFVAAPQKGIEVVAAAATASIHPEAGTSTTRFRGLLFNNAATLGFVQRSASLEPALASFRAGVDLNVTSGLWTCKRFLHFVAAHPHAGKPAVVVNVSSLAAVKPFPSMGNYCFAKAARDMYSRVVASEYAPEVCVLLVYTV